MKKDSLPKKDIFIENINIFDADLIVCFGSNLVDFEYWYKENKKNISKNFNKDYAELLPQIKRGFEHLLNGSNGCCSMLSANENKYYFLFLNKWEKTIGDYDTLLHEIVHLKQFHWERKGITDEVEFEAYFIEKTFVQLRNKLNSLVK